MDRAPRRGDGRRQGRGVRARGAPGPRSAGRSRCPDASGLAPRAAAAAPAVSASATTAPGQAEGGELRVARRGANARL